MKFFSKEIVSIHAAALLIGAAGFLADILAVFRDRLLAGTFGAGRELDMYYAAFQIPDFLFTVFLVGAASSAILPIFLQYWEKDEEDAKKMITALLNVFFLLSGVFAISAVFLAPLIVRRAFPGFSASEQVTTAMLTRIMMLSPILLSISNIIASVMQSFRRFFVYVLTSLCYNVGIIFGILFFVPRFHIVGLALGVILGASLHLLIQLPTFFGLGFRPNPFLGFWHPGVARIMRLSAPRVFTLSINQITGFAVIAFASLLMPGSIAVFQLANNLRYIPVGIFAVSYAISVFPKLSQFVVRNDAKSFSEDFFLTMRNIFFWTMPAAVSFFVLRAHLVRLAFGAGKFNWTDTRLTAAVLGVFSAAMIFDSLILLFVRGFYALGDTRRPFYLSVASGLLVFSSVVFFITPNFAARGIIFWFAGVLKISDVPDVRVIGIPFAFAFGSAFDAVMLYMLLKKTAQARLHDFSSGGAFREMKKIFFASIASGGVMWLGLRFISLFFRLDTFVAVLGEALFSLAVGAAGYVLLLYCFGSEDLIQLFYALKKTLFGLKKVVPEEYVAEK
ncbi:murein biosynthesis integral membrane protein MurJ [Patescibacteria group bacterium]|nr:murein biosynthesis integral membrane protein MurJ [Patescibacteria group bacterium]